MRHDYIRLDKKTLIPDKNGFLNLEVHAATIGVYKYRRQDGTIRRELRLPEEVFSEKSMASFARKPLTIEHKGGLVNSATVGEFTVGATGDNVRQDGNFLAFGIGVHKQDAVKSVMDAKTLGISPGYDCDIEEESSKGGKYPEHTKKYGKFDCIQRNIEANHVTLTATPRGDGCNIRLDSDDALMIEDDSIDNNHNQKDNMSIQRKINSFEVGGVKFDSENLEFEKESKGAVDTLEARVNLLQEELTAKQSKLDSIDAEKDGLKSEVESKEKELLESKTKLDSSIDPKNLQAEVKARVELEKMVKMDSAEMEALSNVELKKKIVVDSKLGHDEAKFDSESYLDAAFDQVKARKKQIPKSTNEHLDSWEDLNKKGSVTQADEMLKLQKMGA